MSAPAGHPLDDFNHRAWQLREEIRAGAAREISEQMVGAVEALLPLGDDAVRSGLLMLCQVWRAQQARGAGIDTARALSAAELLDQFLTALWAWANGQHVSFECGAFRPDCQAICETDARRFAAHWLPKGEIPTQDDRELQEDAGCTTVRAAAAHIDRLTSPERTA